MSVETDVGIGLAAVGAIAAATSAAWSARSVSLSHRPYVYAEREFSTIERSAGIRLRNNGPGVAVEVRYRLGAQGATPTDWSQPVRAMQPGEVLPPVGDPWVVDPPVIGGEPARDWYIETEFGDIRRARWRLVNDRNAPGGVNVKRLRRWKLDLWRLDPNS